ncbi:MAG: DNA repair protein RecN [Spirochaetota bacterium]|nr:DNA repair protein RecN [Spirochaetota bacterium]
MLERISIKNYAIIDNLKLDFHKGFSVFTGETGAGKSVLIGALGLLLGARSDSSMIRSDAEHMIIEGEFSISDLEIQNYLSEFHIDDPSNIIIRREISQQGKNRVFINGNQETLSKLEEIGNRLADMHGQHDHQLLLNKKIHGDVLDSFANLIDLQKEFEIIYQETLLKLEEKNILEKNADSLRQEKDYYNNVFKEISNAHLKENEEEELESELAQIQNKEKIADALNIAHQGVYAADINASMILEDAKKAMNSISSFSKKYEELSEILEDAIIKTRESGHLLSSYVEDSDFNTETLDKTLDRIAFIKELKRKYQKNSIEELITFAQECQLLFDKAYNLDEEITKIAKEYQDLLLRLHQDALILSKKRQSAGVEMSTKIEQELSFLGMESAKFEVKITYAKQDTSFFILNSTPVYISEKGIDRIEFMMSSNIGEAPKSLAKIASGGEISRIMLSLKSALAKSDLVGTGVFDEIDAGIGGMIAHNVALKIQEISKLRQIFCISHLAQIASKADFHYQVRKEDDGNRTFTNVVLLNKEERIKEIARMLGGEGESSERLAREMIG